MQVHTTNTANTTEMQVHTTNTATANTTEMQVHTTNTATNTTEMQVHTTNTATTNTTEMQVHTTNTATTNTTEMQVYTTLLTLLTLLILLIHVSSYCHKRVLILQTQSHYTEKLLFHARGYYVNDYARLFPGYPPPPPFTERHGKKSGEKNGNKIDQNKYPAGASSAREDTSDDAGLVYTFFFIFLIGKNNLKKLKKINETKTWQALERTPALPGRVLYSST